MNKQHFTETEIPDGAFLGILGRGGDLAFKKLCHHYLVYNRNNAIHSNWHISFSFLLIWN